MSPRYSAPESFRREFRRLDPAMQQAFLAARDGLVAALKHHPPEFAPHLRIKRVQGHPKIWELTYAPDGRATFEYGEPKPEDPNDPHVVWRRLGTHDVLREP